MFGPNAPPSTSALLDPLLASLPGPVRRAELFVFADANTLRAITAAIAARDGRAAVEEFLLELTRLRPDDVMILKALARLYQRTGRFTLAEFWIRVALVEAPGDGELHAELVRALTAQSRRDDADAHLWSTLEVAPELAPLQPLALAWWQRHMFDAPALTDARVRALERTRELVCVGEGVARNERVCGLFPAWSLERSGDLEAARARYERWARQGDDPGPLAAFLARHTRCLELRRLLASWRPREARRAEQVRATIERHLDRCYQP